MSAAYQQQAPGAVVSMGSLNGTTMLSMLPHGATARVVAVGGAGAVARRLMEMGVVPGAPVRIVKVAPLGDPIQIRVRGYDLALRRAEAQTISVVLHSEY